MIKRSDCIFGEYKQNLLNPNHKTSIELSRLRWIFSGDPLTLNKTLSLNKTPGNSQGNFDGYLFYHYFVTMPILSSLVAPAVVIINRDSTQFRWIHTSRTLGSPWLIQCKCHPYYPPCYVTILRLEGKTLQAWWSRPTSYLHDNHILHCYNLKTRVKWSPLSIPF